MMGLKFRDILVLLLFMGIVSTLLLKFVPNFGELQNLYFIFLIPGLLVLYTVLFQHKKKILSKFATNSALARLISPITLKKENWKALLIVSAVWLAIMAMVRPQWGYRLEEIERRGVDIVLAVDVSQSMLAEDVEPSRLERAKREIVDLLDKLEGDRVALVAFAGIPFVQCPLTMDYGAVRMFLEQLNPDLIPVPGTAIGSAIQESVKLLKESPRKSKAVILITDGEDHEGDPIAAAKEAKEQGVRVYAIGIGSNESTPIPMDNGRFKTNSQGDMVTTALDETALQKIALETRGAYVRSVTGDMDLEAIYDQDIRINLESQELSSTMQKRWKEGFQFILTPGVLLLVLAMLL